ADPHAPGALHCTGDGAPCRFDLACGHTVRLHRLQPIGTEIQRRAALRVPADTALVRLAVLGALWLQHDRLLFPTVITGLDLAIHVFDARHRCGACSAARRSCAIGSCAMISPLNTHTFTPQVPYVVFAVASPKSMSARRVCSGTRPSRYHSTRAISAPPSRPEQLMRMPRAPSLIADCTARFMARRNATRRSSCWAMVSATSVASISGFLTSTMLRCTSPSVMREMSLRSLSMSAPFLPITTPGRAA